MASWNQLDLKPPPTLTCKVTTSQLSFTDLRKISNECWNALTLLKNQDALSTEAATVSRFIHRLKSMFRHDKGLKSIQKVNQCLRHFLALNLTPVYENLFRTIPWDTSEKDIYCPTRQMLEFVLVRTQGLAALLSRIVHLCFEAASSFKSRMNLGHHWQIALLCFSTVSRIWSLTKHLLNSCINWYSTMLPYLEKFEPKGPLWLPENYVFPSDLTQWLSLPWMDTPESQIESSDDYSQGSWNGRNEEPSDHIEHMCPKITTIHDDVGVSISRDPSSMSSAETTQEEVANKNTIGGQQKNKHKGPKNVGESISRSSIPISLSARTNRNELKDKTMVKGQNQLLGKKKVDVDISPKKKLKTKANKSTIISTISAIQSQNDVEAILKSETKNRSLTCKLGEEQWLLLKNLVNKINLKLKKAHTEKKQHILLEQIRKAFTIALL